MAESLRDKLIRCGWASNFSVDTLVRLVERHYTLLNQQEPQPPADGEAGELVAWLREEATDWANMGQSKESAMLTRAADLLQHQHPQPVAVSERPWERDGWCDADGKCWLETVTLIPDHAVWIKTWPAWVEKFSRCYVRSLPANPLPTPEVANAAGEVTA